MIHVHTNNFFFIIYFSTQNLDDEKDRFDADKHMLMVKTNPHAKLSPVADDNKSDSPDPE